VLYAHRGHVTGALAVFDQLLAAQDHRRSVLAARGHRMVVRLCLACRQLSQRDPTGQRGAALDEIPAGSSFRTHQSLLRTWFFINDAMTKSRPRGREYTRPCQIRPVLMSAKRTIIRPLRPIGFYEYRPNLFQLRSPQTSVLRNDASFRIGTLARAYAPATRASLRASRFSISRAAIVPAATAVGMHGCTGLA